MTAQSGEAAHLQDNSQGAIETEQGHLHHEYDQHNQMLNYHGNADGMSDIEEEDDSSEFFEIGSSSMGENGVDPEAMSLFSFDIHKNSPLGGVECVYVAVGAKGQTSMDALTWTLKKTVADRSNTIVFLVHVFPEIRFVPSALGNLPISGANEQLAQKARSQERGKRSRRLQKYRNICISFKVRVDTILIENDMVAETILDLIPDLNITNLVVGIAKSNLRRLKSNKGNGIADQLLQKAPETCEVKIICEGKEVILEQIEMESRSSSLRNMLLPPLQVNPDKPRSMEMESRSSSLRSMLLPPWLVNPNKPGSMEMESRSSSLRSMLLPPWLVNPDKPKPMKKRKQWVDYFSCSCFKPKAD